jgi:hypothetical protein
MPIYTLECGKCGKKVEELYNSRKSFLEDLEATIDHSQFGASCGGYMFEVWSKPANISLGKPTIIFKNPLTGAKQVATSINEKPPKGFIREELKNPIERARFEKEEASKQKIENEITTYTLEENKKLTRNARHDDIAANLSNIARESHNPSAAESLLKASLNRSKKKRLPPKRTEFHLKINHQDSSNIDKA